MCCSSTSLGMSIIILPGASRCLSISNSGNTNTTRKTGKREQVSLSLEDRMGAVLSQSVLQRRFIGTFGAGSSESCRKRSRTSTTGFDLNDLREMHAPAIWLKPLACRSRDRRNCLLATTGAISVFWKKLQNYGLSGLRARTKALIKRPSTSLRSFGERVATDAPAPL
jgi:hypothetical protein